MEQISIEVFRETNRVLTVIAVQLERIADALTMLDKYGQSGAAAISCAIRDGIRDTK